MPAADYHRVPTDAVYDSPAEEDPSSPQGKFSRNEYKAHRRRTLFTLLGVFLTAVAFYHLGRWSVSTETPATSPAPIVTPSSPAQPGTSVTSKPQPSSAIPINKNDTMTHGAKRSVGYFVNWGIYGRKYMPWYIPAQDLTHILYAFANINAGSGTVAISDSWADQDIHYPGDSWNVPASEKHLYGNFKALYKLKKEHRHLKLLLSIGGWTYSPNFHPVVIDPVKRAEFVRSSVELLDDYGLDGLDVDYEYPSNEEQARGYVDLLRELREALDQRERENGEGCQFLLTIAAPCGPDHYKKLLVPEMDKYLSFWNLMAYDYAGSWDSISGHQANLYGGTINTHDALTFYTSHGVDSTKLVMGIPLYGRSFTNTVAPGAQFNGIGKGTWEKGVYDYRVLPLPYETTYVYNDEHAVASWSLDRVHPTEGSGGELISFDTPRVARLKGQFIRDNNLGGSMFWELSGDKMPVDTPDEVLMKEEREQKSGDGNEVGKQVRDGKSLVRVTKRAMTACDEVHSLDGLETSPNWLKYPRSKFDNLRQGMHD